MGRRSMGILPMLSEPAAGWFGTWALMAGVDAGDSAG